MSNYCIPQQVPNIRVRAQNHKWNTPQKATFSTSTVLHYNVNGKINNTRRIKSTFNNNEKSRSNVENFLTTTQLNHSESQTTATAIIPLTTHTLKYASTDQSQINNDQSFTKQF